MRSPLATPRAMRARAASSMWSRNSAIVEAHIALDERVDRRIALGGVVDELRDGLPGCLRHAAEDSGSARWRPGRSCQSNREREVALADLAHRRARERVDEHPSLGHLVARQAARGSTGEVVVAPPRDPVAAARPRATRWPSRSSSSPSTAHAATRDDRRAPLDLGRVDVGAAAHDQVGAAVLHEQVGRRRRARRCRRCASSPPRNARLVASGRRQ